MGDKWCGWPARQRVGGIRRRGSSMAEPKRYRKVALVTAEQWYPWGPTVDGVHHSAWPYGSASRCPAGNCNPGLNATPYFYVQTKEGPVHLCPGYYVLRQIPDDGYPWPVSPEIFTRTYEEVL